MKQKNIFITIILIVIIASAGIIIWQLLPSAISPAGPITITDDLGREVTIKNYPPKKIVSLAPSTTEILFELGLGDKIVGVDSYSDYPPEAKDIQEVGSFASISIETVTALEPDLVVGTGITQSQIIDKLEEVGLTVVALLPKDVSGVISDITLTGKITGEEAAANDLVKKMNTKIQEVSDKTKDSQKPSVYLEYYFNGGYYSWGSGGLVNELISIAGGTNVYESFSDEYVTTSSEEVIKANPDIIIITKGAMAEAAGLTPDVIKTRIGWDSISAVKNNNIFEVDESSLTRSGPRILDALDELSKIFHSELFS